MFGFVISCNHLYKKRCVIRGIRRIDKLRTVIGLNDPGANAVIGKMGQYPVCKDRSRMPIVHIGKRDKEYATLDIPCRILVHRQSIPVWQLFFLLKPQSKGLIEYIGNIS